MKPRGGEGQNGRLKCPMGFLVRACRIWNCLVDEPDFSLVTLTSLKSILFNYYKTSLFTSFDCEDPRTFKTVCLKCNSVRPLYLDRSFAVCS